MHRDDRRTSGLSTMGAVIFASVTFVVGSFYFPLQNLLT